MGFRRSEASVSQACINNNNWSHNTNHHFPISLDIHTEQKHKIKTRRKNAREVQAKKERRFSDVNSLGVSRPLDVAAFKKKRLAWISSSHVYKFLSATQDFVNVRLEKPRIF